MTNSLLKILPQEVAKTINSYLNLDKISEIRLRAGKPVLVNYGGKNKYLAKNGLVTSSESALKITAMEVNDVVMAAGEFSLYAFNDQIINGFLTVGGGYRLGICGTAVYDSSKLITVKDFSSVTIRFPHEIKGCGDKLYNIMRESKKFNMLIISPPGAGKTTMLRDLARQLSTGEHAKNVMIIDERDEIASMLHGSATLDIGENVDVMNNCSKEFAFESGVRSMCPDIIITDELYSKADVSHIKEAAGSGVSVIASAHAGSLSSFFDRELGKSIAAGKIFDYYAVLSFRSGAGTVENVYDSEMKPVEY